MFTDITEKQLNNYRPVPFYFITTTNPDELSYTSIKDSMETLKKEGFGGIVLFNKPPHGFGAEGYLSPSWFHMVRNFSVVCRELELRLWINDGFDFPPGNAGERITPDKYPHLYQKRLVLSDDQLSVEEVSWGFPAFEEEESAELFHQYVYEAYLKEVGDFFGNPICGFFSDADNRRVNFMVFTEDSPQKNYFPWSNNFSESFRKKYGYDISPYLLKILQKESCPQAVHYWEHAGWLYQTWFRANYKWCREHGLEYTFHTSDSSPFPWEEAERGSLYTEGRALDMESNSDYPGTDQELLEINGGKHMRKEEYWTPRISWAGDCRYVKNPEYYSVFGDLRAKQAGSCAFLHHKKGAMCEMFAASNWGVTFSQLREIAAWQIMQGINFIVPHAYHHRFHGETKYFAPPFFTKGSTLNYGAKQLNDLLSKYCCYTSQGRLKAPIAILDITDSLWERKTSESRTLFHVCEQLNRMPYGYVLADIKSILANKNEFQLIINTGANLSAETQKVLASSGLPVYGPEVLGSLNQFIDCSVSYNGEGQPHFMRRRLDNGKELVVLANIEDGRSIKGTLHIGSVSFDTFLHPGELCFFTEDGPIPVDLYNEELPVEQHELLPLPDCVPVLWEQENMIPIEYWTDEHGNTVTKSSKTSVLNFSYTVTEPGIESLKLLISKRHMNSIISVSFDDIPLFDALDTKVFDDDYLCYTLKKGANTGKHHLELKKNDILSESDRIILQGEFDVKVDYEQPYEICFRSQYCQDNYIPKLAKVTLKKRTAFLSTTASWTEQGHPFYSGKATYCFDLQLTKSCNKTYLYIPQISSGCDIKLDGKNIGQRIFQPYAFPLGNLRGNHNMQITVWNTMANAMEGYKAPSGILSGAYLL